MQKTGEIKNRITSIKKTKQITNAMKMISGVKFRRIEQKLLNNRPYAYSLYEIMDNVLKRNTSLIGDFYKKKLLEQKKNLLIVVIGDRGLCSNYNTNIIKTVLEYIDKNRNTDVFLIGKRGEAAFKRKGINIVKFIHNNSKVYSDDFFSELSKDVLELYKEYTCIYTLYTEFKNTLVRKLTLEQFLPVSNKGNEISGYLINNVSKKTEELSYDEDFSKKEQDFKESLKEKEYLIDFLYEFTEEEVTEQIAIEYIKTKLRHLILESCVSEESARMVAMEAASKNADDMINKLTLMYNRARQAGITTELTEIVSGAEALSN
jgi:F-type H+-transporting ATPase subunit gamma